MEEAENSRGGQVVEEEDKVRGGGGEIQENAISPDAVPLFEHLIGFF